MKIIYKAIEEVPNELTMAYRTGDYKFNSPPVCTVYWDELAWINYVTFDDEIEIFRAE